ncbi:hypothetical protein [Nannocystis pusilla]|uniref:hypothetical protein n=1 Tax=Nannocystis pusilla TaxID=889268 RepID=UPI003B7B6A0A
MSIGTIIGVVMSRKSTVPTASVWPSMRTYGSSVMPIRAFASTPLLLSQATNLRPASRSMPPAAWAHRSSAPARPPTRLPWIVSLVTNT